MPPLPEPQFESVLRQTIGGPLAVRVGNSDGEDDYSVTEFGWEASESETPTQVDLRSANLQEFIDEKYAAGFGVISGQAQLAVIDRPLVLPTSVGTPGTTKFRPVAFRDLVVRKSDTWDMPVSYEEIHHNAVISSFGYDWFLSDDADAIWVDDGVPVLTLQDIRVHGGGGIFDIPHLGNCSEAHGGAEWGEETAYDTDGIAVWGSPKLEGIYVRQCKGVGIRHRRGRHNHEAAMRESDREGSSFRHIDISHCLSGFISEQAPGGGNADGIMQQVDIIICRDTCAWIHGASWKLLQLHIGGCRAKESTVGGYTMDYLNPDGNMARDLRGTGLVLSSLTHKSDIYADNCRLGVVTLAGSDGTHFENLEVYNLVNGDGGYDGVIGLDARARVRVDYLRAKVQTGIGAKLAGRYSKIHDSEFEVSSGGASGFLCVNDHIKVHGFAFGSGGTGALGGQMFESGTSGNPDNYDIDLQVASLTDGLLLGKAAGWRNRVRVYSDGGLTNIINDGGFTASLTAQGNSFEALASS